MVRSILQLTASDLSCALDDEDLVDWLAEELVDRAAGIPRESDIVVYPWRATAAAADRPAPDFALIEDERIGARYVLSVPGLLACRAALLAGLAARLLLGPGARTVAVRGAGAAVSPHLMVIVRHRPRVARILVDPGTVRRGGCIDPAALDRVDLAGIQLTATTTGSAADLVIVVTVTAGRPETGALTAGAVVVNASNRDLPDELVAAVDQLYVDDATLIEQHTDRYFVRRHLDGHRPVAADLGQVLSGAHPGRTHGDHILLVELLSADTLDPRLARVLHRAAVNRRLGSHVYE